MKRVKKWSSVFLSLCMIPALFPAIGSPASAANASAKYEDVVQTEWYVPYIDYVVEHGLMTGTSNAAFAPTGKVTRAQYVQVLYAFAEKPSGAKSAGFKDVSSGKWYTEAVNWAALVGVTGGMTKTTFAPDREVTREQAATFFRAYAEKVAKISIDESKALSSFTDQASISNYAVTPMKWAVGAGLISGIKSGNKTTLSPKATLTRAQLATMMKAFDQYLLSKRSNNIINVVDDKTNEEIQNGEFKKYKNGDIVFTPDTSAIELIGASETGYYNNLINVYTLSDLSKDDALALAKIVNGRIVGDISGAINVIQLLIESSSLSEIQKKADQLMENDSVLYASYDALVNSEESSIIDPWAPNGSKSKDLGNEAKPAGNDWWAEAIKAYSAWEITDKISNAKPVDVGIVDNGFDLKHEDLQNTFIFPAEYTKNSFKSEEHGYHGTHVAGLVSANNNDIGLRGVSCDSKLICVDSTPIVIKILGKERKYEYSTADLIEAIKVLIESNTKVINNSWGKSVDSKDYLQYSEKRYAQYIKDCENDNIESAKNAIAMISSLLIHQTQNGNFLICQAAGNGYKKSKQPEPYDSALLSGTFCSITEEVFNKLPQKTASKLKKNGINYQEIKDHVLIVGAVKNKKTADGRYKAADFSSYGNVVDIYAPGNDIFSTLPDNKYGSLNGTSMACPIVAGSAALIWKANPSLTAKEVKSLLLNSGNSKAIENVTGNVKPMVDLYSAVKMASNNSSNNGTQYENPLIIDDDKVIKSEDSTLVDVLSIGNHHSAAIKKDGSLWMWGSNCYGELGSESGSTTPRKTMDDVTSVSLGYYHSAAIKKDGTLWLWGLNDVGQIGDGSDAEQCKPKKVLDDTVKVSLGWNYSAAIKKDGTLWMWGNNSGGQLGDGTTESHKKPVKIMNDVVDVSCARNVTAAVKKDGTLWIWGYGDYGELGLNETTTSYKPKKLMDGVVSVSLSGAHSTGGHGAALKKDGTLWMWGSNLYGQLGKKGVGQFSSTPIKVLDDVTSVNLGFYHSAAIKKDGTLWLWGSNDVGQIGVGSCDYDAYRFYSSPVKVMDRAVSVSLGGDYSAVLLKDGSLWMWGKNGSSQLGNGTKDISFYPEQIMAPGSISIQNQ